MVGEYLVWFDGRVSGLVWLASIWFGLVGEHLVWFGSDYVVWFGGRVSGLVWWASIWFGLDVVYTQLGPLRLDDGVFVKVMARKGHSDLEKTT